MSSLVYLLMGKLLSAYRIRIYSDGIISYIHKRAMASSRKSTIALTRAIIWPQMPYVNRKNCKFRLFGELYIVDLQSARFVRANYSIHKTVGTIRRGTTRPPSYSLKKNQIRYFPRRRVCREKSARSPLSKTQIERFFRRHVRRKKYLLSPKCALCVRAGRRQGRFG